MSPIREFDIFIARAGEVVLADIDPAIGDIIQIRENFLIDDNLIGSARMTDRIDRAFGRGLDRRDADVHRIQSVIRTRREIPLRGTGGCSSARFGITHHAALRAARGNIQPTFSRILYKVCRAIIHDETGGRRRWIGKLIARGKDARAGINQRRVCHPQRFGLIIDPRVCAAALPAVGINGFSSRVTDEQM